jgi:hypothetical protein
MAHKIDYEFKINKAGHKYALRIDLQTGKKKQVGYKLAQKRARDLKYQRKKAIIVKQIEETGSTATYAEYKKTLRIVEQDIIQRRKDKEQEPLKPSVLRGKVKQETLEYRTGIATRLRYAWVYRVVVERYFDEKIGEMVVECDTSIFKARGLKRNGDYYTRMIDVAQKAHNKIKALDLCSVDGGACVILYNKVDKSIIKKFELGKGCGFSFDFKNYDHDDVEEVDDDGFNWI